MVSQISIFDTHYDHHVDYGDIVAKIPSRAAALRLSVEVLLTLAVFPLPLVFSFLSDFDRFGCFSFCDFQAGVPVSIFSSHDGIHIPFFRSLLRT